MGKFSHIENLKKRFETFNGLSQCGMDTAVRIKIMFVYLKIIEQIFICIPDLYLRKSRGALGV